MINGWTETLLAGIQTLNQILTAGIAITAFSLFLYALSFNLRDRVARSFAIILLCVVIVFTAEALQDKSLTTETIDLLLRLQWFGIVFLPAAYLHLSDALLVTAGRPRVGADELPCAVCMLSLRFSSFCLHLDIYSARSFQTGSLPHIFCGRYGLRSLPCFMLVRWFGRG